MCSHWSLCSFSLCLANVLTEISSNSRTWNKQTKIKIYTNTHAQTKPHIPPSFCRFTLCWDTPSIFSWLTLSSGIDPPAPRPSSLRFLCNHCNSMHMSRRPVSGMLRYPFLSGLAQIQQLWVVKELGERDELYPVLHESRTQVYTFYNHSPGSALPLGRSSMLKSLLKA